jgi:hypothetical protein
MKHTERSALRLPPGPLTMAESHRPADPSSTPRRDRRLLWVAGAFILGLLVATSLFALLVKSDAAASAWGSVVSAALGAGSLAAVLRTDIARDLLQRSRVGRERHDD